MHTGVYAGLAPGYHSAHYRHITAGLPQDSGLLQISGAVPSDQSCPGTQLVDAITLGCAQPCPDDSRPVNGKCVGYSGPAVGPGYMIIAGHAVPRWAVYAAGGVAVLLLITYGLHLFGHKAAVAKVASFLR